MECGKIAGFSLSMRAMKVLLQTKVEEAKWESVSNIIYKGGTMIGASRSEGFRKREERKQAAITLHTHKIYYLVCIGGDGAFTGISIFRDEWEGLTQELLKEGKISQEQAEQGKNLYVVGIAGTIDNDFIGTDRTIGFDSAMARVMECVDGLAATADSLQRTFVVEVMSKECGNLALTSAIALEADFVFIPEVPPAQDWPDVLCSHLQRKRKVRFDFLSLSEGAADSDRKPITVDDIKKIVEEKLKELNWGNVAGWMSRGGSELGTKRQLPADVEKIAEALNDQNIEGLLIVGGFEAFHSAKILQEARNSYSALNIPIIVIPCSVANNVPGVNQINRDD
ncbi:putative 6-phosphofructokinase [Oesophagostomum dentatum]|uniref:Putative 6-phosphofructokinase n=1 Tax=Oesophagostomum dentatum TaxID=61180 RepID=A0A0B1TCH1_OESDE|nr:putative 6-phosphofructokinase [Oesophagostomum dentatum]